METDTNGNLLKKIVYEKDSLEKESDCIAPLPDGGYIVKAHYHDSYNEFYWKIDNEGNIVKSTVIQHHQNSNQTYQTQRMILAPDGGVVLMGQHTFYDLPKLANDSLRFYLVKLNSELEFEWEYEWHECIYQDMSMVRDLMFLDNNNIIVTGCKDRYKFYIAQIHIGKTDVNENLPGNEICLSFKPQPFRDVCEITVTDAAGQYLEVSLYDISGHKVLNLCNETALTDKKSFIVNGSGLAPGVYFVEAKAGSRLLREKIIKVE